MSIDPQYPEIEDFKLERIKLSLIDYDVDNPNEMSEEQDHALDESYRRFGFLAPIIVNKKKNGRFGMVDGEHRARKYETYDKKWISGYVVELSKVDVKILRQIMNKLRGTHDPVKDAAEFAFIQSKGKLETLALLIAQPAEQLVIQKEAVVVTKDTLMVDHHEDTFLHGNLKQLYFIFTNEVYEKLMPRLELIKEHAKVDNNTDMFMKMVKTYEDYHLKTKQ